MSLVDSTALKDLDTPTMDAPAPTFLHEQIAADILSSDENEGYGDGAWTSKAEQNHLDEEVRQKYEVIQKSTGVNNSRPNAVNIGPSISDDTNVGDTDSPEYEGEVSSHNSQEETVIVIGKHNAVEPNLEPVQTSGMLMTSPTVGDWTKTVDEGHIVSGVVTSKVQSAMNGILMERFVEVNASNCLETGFCHKHEDIQNERLHYQQRKHFIPRVTPERISNPLQNPRLNSTNDDMPTIVVTGFDPISKYNNLKNLSWTIVKKFYDSQTNDGLFEHGLTYRILTGPDGEIQPIKTTYSYVASESVDDGDFDSWLQSSNARLYVHLGIASSLDREQSNMFRFDKRAKNGYCGYWTPDKNGESFPGPCINDGPDNICTPFSDESLDNLVANLPGQVTENKINGSFSFKTSKEVGHFLCNFLYYRSLFYAKERNTDLSPDQKSYVVFIHVPTLMWDKDGRECRKDICFSPAAAAVLALIVRKLLDIIPY